MGGYDHPHQGLDELWVICQLQGVLIYLNDLFCLQSHARENSIFYILFRLIGEVNSMYVIDNYLLKKCNIILLFYQIFFSNTIFFCFKKFISQPL